MKHQGWYCRVCGLDNSEYFKEDDPPRDKDGLAANFQYCPCCGVQFGYQDCKISSIRLYRLKWLENGIKWDSPECKPQDSNPLLQLKNIIDEFI